MSRRAFLKLTGGLPFPPPAGGKMSSPSRPLAASRRSLSTKQAQEEDDHLMSVFTWTRQHERHFPQLAGRLCFHAENERMTAPVTVTRKDGHQVTYGSGNQKRVYKGVKKGVVDVLNLRSRRGFTYFAGELKVRKGELTPEQAEFIKQARAEGAFAHTFWCWPELCRAMIWYFGIEDRLVYTSAGEPRDYIVPAYGGHDERCGCGVKLSDLIAYRGGKVYLKNLEG